MKKTTKSQKEEIKNDIPEFRPTTVSTPVLDSEKIGFLEKKIDAPEDPKPTRYKVIAKGGLFLRESPSTDTNSISGMLAGAPVDCMSYGSIFVEIKRINKWSYGNCLGKSGWTCNEYFEKE